MSVKDYCDIEGKTNRANELKSNCGKRYRRRKTAKCCNSNKNKEGVVNKDTFCDCVKCGKSFFTDCKK
ncbi:hypothetical protein ACQ4LE_001606 [Meloidogyne hapla]